MNKFFVFFFVTFITMTLVTAHAGESHEETVDGKIVTLEFLPSEPQAGSSTILAFEVNDEQGTSVTHIDGFLDIKKDGELLVDDYELHSHGNKFSMTYKFLEEGQYTATLTVQPAEHYENEKFDPISVLFYITVEETNSGSNNVLYVGASIIALAILGALAFTLTKKSKKRHSGSQHPHQQE